MGLLGDFGKRVFGRTPRPETSDVPDEPQTNTQLYPALKTFVELVDALDLQAQTKGVYRLAANRKIKFSRFVNLPVFAELRKQLNHITPQTPIEDCEDVFAAVRKLNTIMRDPRFDQVRAPFTLAAQNGIDVGPINLTEASNTLFRVSAAEESILPALKLVRTMTQTGTGYGMHGTRAPRHEHSKR